MVCHSIYLGLCFLSLTFCNHQDTEPWHILLYLCIILNFLQSSYKWIVLKFNFTCSLLVYKNVICVCVCVLICILQPCWTHVLVVGVFWYIPGDFLHGKSYHLPVGLFYFFLSNLYVSLFLSSVITLAKISSTVLYLTIVARVDIFVLLLITVGNTQFFIITYDTRFRLL